MPRIRLLLVDDHPFVLVGIRRWILSRDHFDVVGQASNGQEALTLAQELRPDVVTMDIKMPLLSGLEATRRLRRALPSVKVLILSAHDTHEVAGQIIESGAHGFLCKSAQLADLEVAIRAVYEGKTFFPPGISKALISRYLHRQSAESDRGQLSPREREVLTLIAAGQSNKEAAVVLGVSARTVEKHRERVMAKLDLHSVVDLTKYAIANHMILNPAVAFTAGGQRR